MTLENQLKFQSPFATSVKSKPELNVEERSKPGRFEKSEGERDVPRVPLITWVTTSPAMALPIPCNTPVPIAAVAELGPLPAELATLPAEVAGTDSAGRI